MKTHNRCAELGTILCLAHRTLCDEPRVPLRISAGTTLPLVGILEKNAVCLNKIFDC